MAGNLTGAGNSLKSTSGLVLLGFVLALAALGLPMIGVVVNLLLGALALLSAFILFAIAFWRWKTFDRLGSSARTSILWIFGLVYFGLVGKQMLHQYRKDRRESRGSADASSNLQPPQEKGLNMPSKRTSTAPLGSGPNGESGKDKHPPPPQRPVPIEKGVRSPQQPSYQQQCFGSPCAQGPNSEATLNYYGVRGLDMTHTQAGMLTAYMNPYAGTEITVSCADSGREMKDYCWSIVASLRAAKLVVSDPTFLSAGTLRVGTPGVAIAYSQDERPAVLAFVNGMTAADQVDQEIPLGLEPDRMGYFSIDIHSKTSVPPTTPSGLLPGVPAPSGSSPNLQCQGSACAQGKNSRATFNEYEPL